MEIDTNEIIIQKDVLEGIIKDIPDILSASSGAIYEKLDDGQVRRLYLDDFEKRIAKAKKDLEDLCARAPVIKSASDW